MDGSSISVENIQYDKVAGRLRAARLEHGLTQAKLGELLSVSQDTISLWETGKSIATAEYIFAICKLFDISADYLLGLSDF